MLDEGLLALRFGQTVRRLRKRANFSQESFAAQCAIHRAYMGAIERGQKLVTIGTAQKIATGLGISLVQLFRELEAESSSP